MVADLSSFFKNLFFFFFLINLYRRMQVGKIVQKVKWKIHWYSTGAI